MVRKKVCALLLVVMSLTFLCLGCGGSEQKEEWQGEIPKGKTLLEYQGRASIKIITKEGLVIYVDPYSGTTYDEPADIVLITHEHNDHNNLNLVTQKDTTKVIRVRDALDNEIYKSFEEQGVKIQAVPAYNGNHPKNLGVGYIIEVDGKKIYHAGDTSNIPEMKDLAQQNIDYALLPYDGEFNMGPDEAAKVAGEINAGKIIPIHGISQDPSDIKVENLLIVKKGEKIEL